MPRPNCVIIGCSLSLKHKLPQFKFPLKMMNIAQSGEPV